MFQKQEPCFIQKLGPRFRIRKQKIKGGGVGGGVGGWWGGY